MGHSKGDDDDGDSGDIDDGDDIHDDDDDDDEDDGDEESRIAVLQFRRRRLPLLSGLVPFSAPVRAPRRRLPRGGRRRSSWPTALKSAWPIA